MQKRTATLLAAIAILAAAPLTTASAEADADSIVKGLDAVFGPKGPGQRAAHTNGICVKGSFTAAPGASKLSKAPQFADSSPHPVVGRFSMGGGNPSAPNNAQDNARGFAVHIDIGKGNTTDLVLLSAPVFVAKNPDDFLTLLQTVAAKDKAKIGAYFAAHPEGTRQQAWLMARPVPASYASVSYYSVHTFTLVNGKGERQPVKLKAVPVKGEAGLTPDEAKAKAPDFYAPELKERLAAGPAEFTLTAVLGTKDDPADDPTALWPEDRPTVPLGTLAIAALEDNATCDAGMFDPNNLADGVEAPANDTILPMRSAAYAVSLSRRAK